jgi:phenylacetate-CoA ligase
MVATDERQLAALNRLVAEIAPSNQFYRRKLTNAAGLNGFTSLADYRERMPFTTKSELTRDQAENPPYGSTLTYPLSSYTRYHQTSGTGGSPLIWLDTPQSWQWLVDNWKTVWQKAGAQPGDTALFAFSFGPFLGFWSGFEAIVQLGLRAIPAGGLSSSERLRFIMARRPRFLCCTPTYALRLTEVARNDSIDLGNSGVERIVVGGEPGGSVPEIRARIEQSWTTAKVFDHHGMTEVGPVSYTIPGDTNVLRIIHPSYFCEILKPGTNEPVANGELGEFVVTTLGRTACPLLRYRTGDLVKPIMVSDEGPPEIALAGGVLGRADDMVIVRGVNLYPSAVEAVIRSVNGVREYQVEIDKRRTLPEVIIRFETADGSDPSSELSKQLRATFQMRFDVQKVANGTLPVFEMKARRWKILS